jgi:hypothetical protein
VVVDVRDLVVLDRQDLEPGEIPATQGRTDTHTRTPRQVFLRSGKPCGHEERTGCIKRVHLQTIQEQPNHPQPQPQPHHSHTRTGIQQEFPRDHFDLDSTPSKPAFCRTRAEGKTGYARAGTRQQTELDELHKRKRRLGTKRECLCETGAFYICGLKRRNSVQAHR